MNNSLWFNLVTGLFSFRKGNMRNLNLRRIIMVCLFLPIFLINLLINRIFLALDYLFYPEFLSQKIIKPVFIIAAPRSGTTFLFHKLAFNSGKFTCFKLWEIVFAPSVIQKYFYISFFRLDAWIGGPIKKLILYSEKLIFSKLSNIHLIGLSLPEEDEPVLLWSLSSAYLNFFYPDSDFFDDYLLFDKALALKFKKMIMDQYLRYLKRHAFVFNRNCEKQFLSKNPIMMGKIESLYQIFPDALVLNINRCPKETIPSSIQLINRLFGLFTSIKGGTAVNSKIKNLLINWYEMAENALSNIHPQNLLRINFKKLVRHDETEINQICSFLSLDTEMFLNGRNTESSDKVHVSSNKYSKLSELELNAVLEKLTHLKSYCHEHA
ncbi:MAG: sulfotransferase [Bacteroidales bacterium]